VTALATARLSLRLVAGADASSQDTGPATALVWAAA
jgi:hypothetical protein